MDLSKLIHGFSKLLDGFVRINTRISPSWYMDLSKLVLGFVKVLQGFVKVVLCFSRSLPNKTKLKFDQDFKAHWSFCFEIKLLNESKYLMPWTLCALGNICILNSFTWLCFQSDGGPYINVFTPLLAPQHDGHKNFCLDYASTLFPW